MEEEQQGDDDMIEIKYGIYIEPCDCKFCPEDNVLVDSTSKYNNTDDTQKEEGSFVSLRSHRRLMKAKNVIIHELEMQVDLLENWNKTLKFQKQKLEIEVSKLKEEAEVQIVREVIRNQSPVNNDWQCVTGVDVKAKLKESLKIGESATSNTINRRNICTAKTAKLSRQRHSIRVAQAHLKHFECSCGKLYKSWFGIRYHTYLKNNRLVHNCEICSKWYTSHTSLKEHQKKIHNVIPIDQFACWACGNMFNSLKEVRQHRRIVHPKQRKTWKA